MRKGIITGFAVALVAAGAILVAAPKAVIAAVFPRILSLATGYDISFGDERLELNHAALLRVRVSRGGEPVLEAARIDIGFSLRDLLPGSKHRYGIGSIAIDRPTLTLVRHKDGSYNVVFPRPGGPAPIGPVPANLVPLAMTLRIRDAAGDVRAPFALDPQSRTFKVRGVNLDATVDSAARTHYTLSGSFIEHPDEPFTATGTIDIERGFAMHHVYAAAIPLRAIANYFIDSDAAQILAGTASNFDARIYSLDVPPSGPVAYHVSAGLDVSNGGLAIIGLARPLGDIAGHLQLVDDTFFAKGLKATLAGAPVVVTGGIYDFAAPKYQLGITARSDLAKLRAVFSFSQDQPVSGSADVGVLVEGELDAPVIVANVDASNVAYRKVPLRDVHANVAFSNGTLLLAPVRARTSGADLAITGTVTAKIPTHSQLVLHISAPADRLPYAGELLGSEPLVADAFLDGHDEKFSVRGSLASTRGADRVAANFTFEPGGIISIAPFWLNTQRGVVDGAYHLDRSRDASNFWLTAAGLDLRAPDHASFLDAALPQVPPIDGHIDRVAIEGGGPSGPKAFAAGTLTASAMRVAGVRIDTLDARFAGTVGHAMIEPARATGPWGTIAGRGEFDNDVLVVRGEYRGELRGLRPFLGNVSAGGTIAGPLALAVAPGRITVQGDNLELRNANIRGIPLSRVSGTIALAGGVLHVYSARAKLAGGEAVAAGTYDTQRRGANALSIVASGLQAAGLHAIGIPLDAGRVDADGRFSAQAPLPQFDGGVAVADGRVQHYRVAGSGIVHLGGAALRFENLVGALDGTYALARGGVSALTGGAPQYAMHADVPAGDLASALRTLAIPGFASDGTFNASLAIGGRGLQPSVRGLIGVPAGSVNGLPFVDAAATVSADPGGVIARRGNVLVGDTA
ncbi:MAG: hypothetical protein ABI282_05875, partial [Candidatus Baltobacteraceae bacterium]